MEGSKILAQRLALAASNGRLIRFFQNLAQERGWTFQTALNSDDALELALASPPDLFVIDVFLESVNGVELRGRMRRHPGTQMVPILLVATGCDTAEDLTRRLEIARFRCHSKKLNLASLTEEVERWMSGAGSGGDSAAGFRYPTFLQAAGEACHAANQPLTSLICSAELMLRQELEEGVQKRVQMMYDSAMKIMQVIKGFQEVKRDEEDAFNIPILLLPRGEDERHAASAAITPSESQAG